MRQVKPVPVRAPLVSTKVKVAAVEVPSMMSTVVVNKSNAFEASVTQPGGTHASATCTALLSDDTLTATADCTMNPPLLTSKSLFVLESMVRMLYAVVQTSPIFFSAAVFFEVNTDKNLAGAALFTEAD